MAFSNNVAAHRLVLNHDDETHGSIDVVPDPSHLESDVNTDNNGISGVGTHFENMDISRNSNISAIGDVGEIAVCALPRTDAADTNADINDMEKVTKDNHDISNTANITSDIDEAIDDDNKNIDDAADTNNNNEVTRINDILNVSLDNNDISYTVLTTFDIDESIDDANSAVDDIANTNTNKVSLIDSPIPNDESTTDSVKTNAQLAIVPTLNCKESPDMPNIIRIVNRPRTNNTNKPFSQAVKSPLPSKQVSSPTLSDKKSCKLLEKHESTPSLPVKQSSTPPLSNNQGSISPLPDTQDSRPSLQTNSSTPSLPDDTTQSCCTCPSQLIIQPQIFINMDGCYCCPQEPFSVPPNIPWHNAQFSPPHYPQFNNSAPLPYPQFNRAPFPYPEINCAPLPYPQFNCAPSSYPQLSRAPLPYPQFNCPTSSYPQFNCAPSSYPQFNSALSSYPHINCPTSSYPQFNCAPSSYPQYDCAPSSYPQFNCAPSSYPQFNSAPSSYPQFSRVPLPRMQQGEQVMFVPRQTGQSEQRVSQPYRTRMPYMEHLQRNAPSPKNLQPMQGNFPPQQHFPNSYTRLPRMGFSRSPTSPVRPHFQPPNPNGMNVPRYWRNNVPNAPIYPPSFNRARPHAHPMPPPSFYPKQWFPCDFIEFHRPMSAPSRFQRRPPPGFDNVELEPIPEVSEEHEGDLSDQDQIKRKKGQLPLYLRKT